jgi:hypothetical protein
MQNMVHDGQHQSILQAQQVQVKNLIHRQYIPKLKLIFNFFFILLGAHFIQKLFLQHFKG